MPLCGIPIDLVICQGKTFEKSLRWGTSPYVYKAIADIPSLVPVRLEVLAHGLIDGWSVAVAGVQGTTQINARDPNKLRPQDFYQVTVLDVDNIELNRLNGSNFGAYTSGGFIQYATPVDLAAYPDAAMQIRDPKTDLLLSDLSVTNGKIVLNNALKKILLTIPDAETETFTWRKGIYDLELYTGISTVGLVSGRVSVSDEVTQ